MFQFGLIGYPIKNGFSKDFFTKKFNELGLIGYSYRNFPIPDIKLVKDMLVFHPTIEGFNVTIPYKQSIIPYLNEIDKSAKDVEAVNCVKVIRNSKTPDEYKLIGYNTDVYGFELSLLSFVKDIITIKKAIVLGNGGASKAVQYVLKKLGVKIIIVARQSNNDCIVYDELSKEIIESSQLIVNCTPVGMYPNMDNLLPFPFEFLNNTHYCYDLIYIPEESSFLRESKSYGAASKNGLEMLHLQAEKSWEIWEK
ncbi:MAG: shikimate dehydrogenase [Bacteroidetes bacterium]|nr:shikimate dehydrogenase [Bacteroidota bacterium]